jgi:pantoate--beta-alanine ligase
VDVLTRASQVRAWRAAAGPGGSAATVGLVPTMGALHEGHLALLRGLRPRVDRLAVSIYVNPTQFGPSEDLASYPRDLGRDLRLAAGAGADAAFVPADGEMYPVSPPSVFVDVEGLSGVLEGAERPGHFRGVATVVAKLLALFAPEAAAFGQKDAQQCLLVRRLARELLLPVEILVFPTVREPDGLAMSSRNAYLTAEERRAAPALHAGLRAARDALAAGERDAAALEALIAARVAGQAPMARLDYAAVRRAADLSPFPAGRVEGRCLLLVAARFPSARLIDNLCLRLDGGGVADDLP